MEVKGHIGVGVVSAHRVLLENVLLQGDRHSDTGVLSRATPALCRPPPARWPPTRRACRSGRSAWEQRSTLLVMLKLSRTPRW